MSAIARCLFVLGSVACLGGAAFAHDERVLPGHSRHGEIFDTGPRQSAYLMGGTGKVRFPVTCKDPKAQKLIEQGIGQLHGFWYVEAERSFRAAAALDPTCEGMAWWGVSLANELRPARAKKFAQLAATKKTGISEREQMYIDALDSEKGFRPIIAKYPKDLEAQALEVWRSWFRIEHGSAEGSEVGDALEMARSILRTEPMHPINHAVIHICNATGADSRAIDSAAVCGDAAPSIGHMWHMPTHIYFQLHRYPQAAWQLEASIRTEHARMMHDRVLPDQVHLYAHNNEWLVRTLLYLGRAGDARRTARHMIDLPRHPLFNVIEPPDDDDALAEDELHGEKKIVEVHGTSAYYGRDRLLQTLRTYEYWDDLVDECKSQYIEATSLPVEQAKIHLNLGIAAYCTGKIADGDRELEEIKRIAAEQGTEFNAAIEGISETSKPERAKAMQAIEKRFKRAVGGMTGIVLELQSYRHIVTGFFLSRRMLLVCLAGLLAVEVVAVWMLRRRLMWAALTVPVAIAGGVWLFQSHLALLNLPYDSVNVDFAFMARKQLEAGDPDVAEWCAREFAENRPFQVKPQANLVEILYQVGKKDEARYEFEKLRELAGTADLDSPPMVRLAPIAQEFGLPTDWRLPNAMNKSLAGRRSLKSLGPLVWRPWMAPDWKLKDADGKEHSLAEFHGKPVLMLFYLGRGCLHCKQQLESFAKKTDELGKQGINVVAVSVDDQAGIKKSVDDYKPAKFPFLMLADDKLDVFQSYRTFDNFENVPLHGTFLIDREGYVRWHDVSFQPFTDVNFVLNESKRLLNRPVPPIEQGARVIVDDNQPVQQPVANR